MKRGAIILWAVLLAAGGSTALAWDTNDWEFVDTIQRASFRAFRDTKVGPYQLTCDAIIYDNPYNFGPITSDAGIGFKLASMCVGHYRGWVSYDEAYGEVLRLLKAFGNELSREPDVFPRVNGWLYHFYNNGDGTMNPKDGVSLLDHMLFVGGVILAGEYFKGTEAGDLALRLYSETQWDAKGDGEYDWDYSEDLLAIIEAADAPQHSKHATASNMWYTVTEHDPYQLPLYYWQYPHSYVDFRFRWDPRGINHANRALQTILHQRTWCTDRFNGEPWKYETYTNSTFGLSACGSSTGYRILNAIDEWSCDSGSIAPIAIPGCMIYAGTETMATLKYLFEEYYIKGCPPPRIPIWSDVYGFANCYNIGLASSGAGYFYNGWNADIDYGPNVLLLENHRLGTVWRYFMQNPCIATAMTTVGFGPVQNVTFADFTNAANQFGGGLGHWENDGTPATAGYVLLSSNVNPQVAGHVVRFTADNSREGGWIELGNRDERGHAQISFWVRGHSGNERVRVGLKDSFNRENKVGLLDYTGGVMPTNWAEVKIPIEAFCITGVISNDVWPGNLPLISFEFTNSAGGGLDIDYLAFGPDTIQPSAPTSRVEVALFNGHPRVYRSPQDRERDVAGYALWRRTGGTGDFVRAGRLLAPAHQRYADDEDYAGLPGETLEYAIQAWDNALIANAGGLGPSNTFVSAGGGRTELDLNNGHNPNVFGGTNDGYWGAVATQTFDFVWQLLPYGWTGWVRRSYVSVPTGGHYVDLNGGDAGDAWGLDFWIRGDAGGEGIEVGLKDSDLHEVKLPVTAYLGGPITTVWRRVIVPFSDFTNVNVTSLHNASFTHTTSGTVYLAGLGFNLGQRSLLLDSHLKEAEHSEEHRGGRVRDFKSAASGREVLGEGWGASTNDYADYDFYYDGALTGQFFSARYACSDGDGRAVQVRWDGAELGPLDFANTGGWGEDGWHYRWARIPLPVVTGGWHRLRLWIASNDSPVNVDCLTVAEERPYFAECENYVSQVGSSNRDYKAGASGGEVLGWNWGLDGASEAVYTNLGSHAITGAWFHLWYALDSYSGRVVDVYVDGVRRARLACTRTSGWGDRACQFDQASALLGALDAGPHTVRLAVPEGNLAINLDAFAISEGGPEARARDSDSDGLGDRQEALAGTLSGVADSDGDGLSDGDEVQFGKYGQISDPTKADTDNDGMNDLEEAVAGTDPNVAGSFFQCLEISARNLPMFGKTLRWNATSGRMYSIYASSNLLTSDFQPLIADLPAAPPENTWTDTVSGVELLYYRIGVRRP